MNARRAGRTRSVPPSELLWLGLIVLLALALRAVALLAIEPTPLAGDEPDYYRRAAQLATEGQMLGVGERAPGNELFLAALFQLLGVSTLVARAGNVAVGAATAIPIYALGRQLGGGRTGLVAAALAAVYPNFIAYSHYLWAEPLYVFLSTSGLALLGSRCGQPPLRSAALAGLLFGAAALTREVGLAFGILGTAWLYLSSRAGPGEAAARAALFAAAFAAVILPWALRVNAGGGDFALVTRTSYMNLYIGNVEPRRLPGAGVGVGPAKHYWSLGRDRRERERAARALALDAIAQRMPWWPAEKLVEQLPRFFTPTSFAVRRLLMKREAPEPDRSWAYRFPWAFADARPVRWLLVGVVAVGYAAVAVAGIGGLILARRRAVAGLLAVFLVAQILPTLVTFASSRFRLASMAVLVAGAAVWLAGGEGAWTAAGPGRRRAAALTMVLLGIVILCRYRDALTATWG